MRFWTTQSEKVLGYILNDGIYNPDFALSDGLGGLAMKNGYDDILDEYKRRNSIDCTGLIFGITELEDVKVKTIEQYRKFFTNNLDFWDSVSCANSDYAMLELELPDDIDIIPIYFQDFIILGMRSVHDSEFQMYVKPSLRNVPFQDFKSDLAIAQTIGWTNDSAFWDYSIPCYLLQVDAILQKIIQAHFHQISIDFIKGVHETYNAPKQSIIPLGPNALKLRQLINK